ncbi:MAG: PDZ domain-containing protein [Anaeromyxobacteraceae bacterium]
MYAERRLVVQHVAGGGLGSTFGLAIGDRILAVDGVAPKGLLELKAAIRAHRDGPLVLAVERDGARLELRAGSEVPAPASSAAAGLPSRPSATPVSKPRAPAGVERTRRVGERCVWSEQCLPGLVCPQDHCVPERRPPGDGG